MKNGRLFSAIDSALKVARQLQIMRKVQGAWDEAMRCMEKMDQASIVRPSSSQNVITPHNASNTTPDCVAKFDIGPVVIHLNERAGRRKMLYIVLQGSLTLQSADAGEEQFTTRDFGTHVAYFRSKRDKLQHIFGAHYDMEKNDKRHPVFHAQMDCKKSLGELVNQYFPPENEIENHMDGVLRTARIPTAQMDIFSVIIQICADHLIAKSEMDRPPEVTRAFQELRESCDFFSGAARAFPHLSSEVARNCLRSSHWYARLT